MAHELFASHSTDARLADLKTNCEDVISARASASMQIGSGLAWVESSSVSLESLEAVALGVLDPDSDGEGVGTLGEGELLGDGEAVAETELLADGRLVDDGVVEIDGETVAENVGIGDGVRIFCLLFPFTSTYTPSRYSNATNLCELHMPFLSSESVNCTHISPRLQSVDFLHTVSLLFCALHMHNSRPLQLPYSSVEC